MRNPEHRGGSEEDGKPRGVKPPVRDQRLVELRSAVSRKCRQLIRTTGSRLVERKGPGLARVVVGAFLASLGAEECFVVSESLARSYTVDDFDNDVSFGDFDSDESVRIADRTRTDAHPGGVAIYPHGFSVRVRLLGAKLAACAALGAIGWKPGGATGWKTYVPKSGRPRSNPWRVRVAHAHRPAQPAAPARPTQSPPQDRPLCPRRR